MHMSGESLIVILLVGIIAGWLAGQIMRGTGFGLLGDLVTGVTGAFIGGAASARYPSRSGDGRRNYQCHYRRHAAPVCLEPHPRPWRILAQGMGSLVNQFSCVAKL